MLDMDPIDFGAPLPRLEKLPGETTGPTESENKAESFGDMLADAMGTVDDLQKQANQAVEDLVTGKEKDIHGTMIAMKKAELSLKLMLNIRNKALAAYDEIKRMHLLTSKR